MIQSIYQIGKAVMQDTSGKRAFLESLAKEPPTPKNGQPKIAVLKFNTKASTLDIEVRELSNEGDNTVERYLWLGNAASSASNQDRLTTDGLHYLVSQTLPNLLASITIDTPLYEKLTQIDSELYIDLGEPNELGASGGMSYRRSRRVLNLPKLNIRGSSLEDLQNIVREEASAKSLPKLIAGELQEHFEDRLDKGRMLFTLEVDGDLLVDRAEYIDYLENVYVGEIFTDAQIGCCHLTGKQLPVTSNLTRLKFKYYITDKLGFAAGGIQKGFDCNIGISQEAYIALLIGERFVTRELSFYLAGTTGYVLPNLYFNGMTSDTITDIQFAMRSLKRRTDINLGIQHDLDALVGHPL